MHISTRGVKVISHTLGLRPQFGINGAPAGVTSDLPGKKQAISAAPSGRGARRSLEHLGPPRPRRRCLARLSLPLLLKPASGPPSATST